MRNHADNGEIASSSFAASLGERLAANSVSNKELAARIGRDPSTLYRARQGEPTSRTTAELLDRELGASGQLVAAWTAEFGDPEPGTPTASLTRRQVAGVKVQELTARQRRAEYERYVERPLPSLPYSEPPPIIASSKRQLVLEVLNPLPLREVDAVLHSRKRDGLRWRPSTSRQHAAKVFSILTSLQAELVRAHEAGQGIDDEGELSAIEALAVSLGMTDRVGSVRSSSVIFVLCGQVGHDAIVAKAAQVCTATRPAPHVVVLGAPAAASPSSSLLSEADALWHSLRELPRRGLDLERVTLDARATMFAECAALSLRHLHALPLSGTPPFEVGLVSGRLQMRRAFNIFRAAYEPHEHLVRSLSVFPAADLETFPVGDRVLATSWLDAILLETRKLLHTRLAGLG